MADAREIAVLQDRAHELLDKAQSLYGQAKRTYKEGLEILKEADKAAGIKLTKVEIDENAFMNSDVGEIPERPKPVLKKAVAPLLKKTIDKPVLLKKKIYSKTI